MTLMLNQDIRLLISIGGLLYSCLAYLLLTATMWQFESGASKWREHKKKERCGVTKADTVFQFCHHQLPCRRILSSN